MHMHMHMHMQMDMCMHMSTGGNHELSNTEAWVSYNARYPMPYRQSGSVSSLQPTSYKSQATSYKLQVTSYKLQVTRYKLHGRGGTVWALARA